MARFRPEPPYRHGSPDRTGVLLANLGTPAAPTAEAIRSYLKEFLSDPRVVELPRLPWWLILNGYILNVRPKKSVPKYASIWMDEGSPLKVHTERQARLLAGYLLEHGHPELVVDHAMRYGSPSIPDAMERLRAKGCTRILVVPLYPQYAAHTTASCIDEVARCLTHWRNLPEVRYVRSFHDQPDYISALATSVREHWRRNGQGERLVMSFHGLPRRALDLGDPYHCECHKSARLLAEALGLPPERWKVTFQSRFGRAEWLQPYTEPSLEALAREGVRHVDVICPGFVSDCLETLEEIAIECKAAFLAAGGSVFHYVPCLNEDHDWISALEKITVSHLGNWLERAEPVAEQLQETRRRALAAGALE
ncbi:MAG: ferrochelatase [Rhodocyclaceae bacterium]|jgi:ferrochelatase|nr:ferrochelatase [Rhodocyclaceae bacterium]